MTGNKENYFGGSETTNFILMEAPRPETVEDFLSSDSVDGATLELLWF